MPAMSATVPVCRLVWPSTPCTCKFAPTYLGRLSTRQPARRDRTFRPLVAPPKKPYNLRGRTRVAGMRMQHALLSIILAAAAAASEEEVPDGMVRIKGGKFVMGIAVQDSRDSLAQQAVEVREFFLDKTATTNWQFRAFRKATSYQTESQSFGWSFVLELHATEEAKVSLALGLGLALTSALPSPSPCSSPSPAPSRAPQGDHQLVRQGCVPLVGGAGRELAVAAWPRLRHQRPPLPPSGARLVERRQGLLQVGGQAVSGPAAPPRAREAAALCT